MWLNYFCMTLPALDNYELKFLSIHVTTQICSFDDIDGFMTYNYNSFSFCSHKQKSDRCVSLLGGELSTVNRLSSNLSATYEFIVLIRAIRASLNSRNPESAVFKVYTCFHYEESFEEVTQFTNKFLA